MDQVASCRRGMARHHNAGDHGVAKLNRPSLALTGGRQVCGLRGSSIIERSDSLTHFLNVSCKRL
jgi:hypothetical protein